MQLVKETVLKYAKEFKGALQDHDTKWWQKLVICTIAAPICASFFGFYFAKDVLATKKWFEVGDLVMDIFSGKFYIIMSHMHYNDRDPECIFYYTVYDVEAMCEKNKCNRVLMRAQ